MIKSGGSQIVNTPEWLMEQAIAYFTWCEDNPIKTKRTISSGKAAGTTTTVEHTRLYNIKAFCVYAGISERYLKEISETNDKNSEYYKIVEKILSVIYSQNLEGAAADIFNPIIVSKVLNLDKEENKEKENNVKVEIVNSISSRLANSESEVLQNLDFEKVNLVIDKAENLKRENDTGKDSHAHNPVQG